MSRTRIPHWKQDTDLVEALAQLYRRIVALEASSPAGQPTTVSPTKEGTDVPDPLAAWFEKQDWWDKRAAMFWLKADLRATTSDTVAPSSRCDHWWKLISQVYPSAGLATPLEYCGNICGAYRYGGKILVPPAVSAEVR